jgi:hypothetical protein
VYSYFWAKMARLALDRVKADGDSVEPLQQPLEAVSATGHAQLR